MTKENLNLRQNGYLNMKLDVNSEKKILASIDVNNSPKSSIYTVEEFDEDVITDELAVFTVEARITSKTFGTLYPDILIINW